VNFDTVDHERKKIINFIKEKRKAIVGVIAIISLYILIVSFGIAGFYW